MIESIHLTLKLAVLSLFPLFVKFHVSVRCFRPANIAAKPLLGNKTEIIQYYYGKDKVFP